GVIVVGCAAAAAPSVPIPASSSTTSQAITTPTTSPSSVPRTNATPLATPRPTPPPPLTAVKTTRQGCYTGSEPDGVPSGTCTTTITWKKIATEGTEIEVYGVNGCLSRREGADDGSCLVPDTPVPASARKLIARAPVANGAVSWTGPAWLDVIDADTGAPRSQAIGVDRHGDDIYFAIIVASSNEAGGSKFVMADAGSWCYDTGCEGP